MKKMIIVLTISLTAGCGAYKPYKPFGTGGFVGKNTGYEDFNIKGNTYHITYTGGTGSSPSDAVKYMYMRAKDLCKEKGFNDYEMANNSQSQKGSITNTAAAQYGFVTTSSQPVASADVTCK